MNLVFYLTVTDMHKTSMEALAIVQLNTSLLLRLTEQQHDRIRLRAVQCINDFSLT